MSRVVAMVACGFTLAACSTSLVRTTSSPPTQALRIDSKPTGAEAKTSLGQSCRTPCELDVQAADEISLTLALNGYQPQTVAIRKDTADSSQLAPNPINVELQPLPATSAKKRAAAKKRPAAAAAGSRPICIGPTRPGSGASGGSANHAGASRGSGYIRDRLSLAIPIEFGSNHLPHRPPAKKKPRQSGAWTRHRCGSTHRGGALGGRGCGFKAARCGGRGCGFKPEYPEA
jgi:hypothetical protein